MRHYLVLSDLVVVGPLAVCGGAHEKKGVSNQ